MHRFCLLTLWKLKDTLSTMMETSSIICNNNPHDIWENIMKMLTSKSLQVHVSTFYSNGEVEKIIIYNYDEL